MGGVLYITDSDGNLNIFNVKRNDDGELWLNTNYDNADNQWNPDNRWVFLRQRNSFLSLLSILLGRVLFRKLSVPTPKHFT